MPTDLSASFIATFSPPCQKVGGQPHFCYIYIYAYVCVLVAFLATFSISEHQILGLVIVTTLAFMSTMVVLRGWI